MIGKSVQATPRVKRLPFSGRHHHTKDDGSGQKEKGMARCSSASNPSTPQRDADPSSTALFRRSLLSEDRLSSSGGGQGSSKAGKFKSKIRSGAQRRERDNEVLTDHDGSNISSSGSRGVPLGSQRTPPKRHVFRNGDSRAKPQHRSKSTNNKIAITSIDTSLIADALLSSDTNRVTFDSVRPQGETPALSGVSSNTDGEDLSSPERDEDRALKSHSHKRMGPRTSTTGDIFAILSPRKRGSNHTPTRTLSPPETTSALLFNNVAQTIDFSDTFETDLPDDEYTPKRGGLKLQKKALRKKHDRADKTSHDKSLANTRTVCPQCAAETLSAQSSDTSNEVGALVSEVAAGAEIEELRKRLAECEEEVEALTKASARNDDLFRAEVERFKRILGTVDQAQELRYHSLLEVFTDNFKTMGTVEARFEQMLGTRHGQMQRSGRGRLLQFLWVIIDFSVKALFQIAQTIYKSHKFLKTRRRARATTG